MFIVTNGNKKYGVRFYHNIEPKNGDEPSSGCKIVELGATKEENKLVSVGTSVLAKGDQYSRPVARKLTLGRALNAAGFDKNTKREFWKEYFWNHDSEPLPSLREFDPR
jgi:hypothetical protein